MFVNILFIFFIFCMSINKNKGLNKEKIVDFDIDKYICYKIEILF